MKLISRWEKDEEDDIKNRHDVWEKDLKARKKLEEARKYLVPVVCRQSR